MLVRRDDKVRFGLWVNKEPKGKKKLVDFQEAAMSVDVPKQVRPRTMRGMMMMMMMVMRMRRITIMVVLMTMTMRPDCGMSMMRYGDGDDDRPLTGDAGVPRRAEPLPALLAAGAAAECRGGL
jgi:hypothetical protein